MIDIETFNDPAADTPESGYHAPWYADLLACARCSCRPEAKRVVPGVGIRKAGFLFLGQNPGDEEDEAGFPFVGRAGDELDVWLKILGLARQKVVLTNVCKCHTTKNRPLRKGEVAICTTEWLTKELAYFTGVEVLLPLGVPATEVVLGKTKLPAVGEPSWTQVKAGDRLFHVVPLPHPAYLLRKPSVRPEVYNRLLPTVRDYLARTVPEAYERAGAPG